MCSRADNGNGQPSDVPWIRRALTLTARPGALGSVAAGRSTQCHLQGGGATASAAASPGNPVQDRTCHWAHEFLGFGLSPSCGSSRVAPIRRSWPTAASPTPSGRSRKTVRYASRQTSTCLVVCPRGSRLPATSQWMSCSHQRREALRGHGGTICMSHSGSKLRIEVTDFGLGGADPAGGSGLASVERVAGDFRWHPRDPQSCWRPDDSGH
jgi:hypothetical protein